jgi:hypothetical protein
MQKASDLARRCPAKNSKFEQFQTSLDKFEQV